jgi:hypothetical protein
MSEDGVPLRCMGTMEAHPHTSLCLNVSVGRCAQFYSSPVVASLARSLYLVSLPGVFVSQLNIISRLHNEITCLSNVLVASNLATGYLNVNALASTLIALYANFYINVDTQRVYSIATLPESLAIERLVVGEVDYALINTAQLAPADIKLLNSAAVAVVPAFLAGVVPIFNLPTPIQTLYANPALILTLGLPPLYPLYLTLEVMTVLFLGQIGSWLDPQLVALNPQLPAYFTASGASDNLTLIVGSTSPLSSLRATRLLWQTMAASQTAALDSSAYAFPLGGWTTIDETGLTTTVNPFTAVLARYPTTVQMIDFEARLTLKMSAVSGSVSYRLLGTGEATTSTTGLTDATVEWQLKQVNSLGVSEIVQPTTGALRQCSVGHLSLPGVRSVLPVTSLANSAPIDSIDSSAVSAKIALLSLISTQSRWVMPASPAPACWPISTMLSFVVPLSYTAAATVAADAAGSSSLTSGTCAAGVHALEFIHYMQSTPVLTAPAEAAGLIRMAESTLIRQLSEHALYKAVCDGVPLLVVPPIYYTIPASISNFGLSISVVGLICIFICSVIVIRHRAHVVMRSSSVPFLLMTLLGVGMLLVAAGAWSSPPHANSCAIFGWLSNIGFSLLFVPLFLKTWRVWRIASATHLKVATLTNLHMISMAGAVILLDLVLMCIWQAVSPMQPIEYSKLIDVRHEEARGTRAQGAEGGAEEPSCMLLHASSASSMKH